MDRAHLSSTPTHIYLSHRYTPIMTKRASVSGPEIVHDVDMSAADQSTKKVKLDHDDTFAYPQDEYVIRSDFLKNSRFEVLYMEVRARAELPRLLLEYVGVSTLL